MPPAADTIPSSKNPPSPAKRVGADALIINANQKLGSTLL